MSYRCCTSGLNPPAYNTAGQPIYHTNVIMCVATDFAMIGTETIRDSVRRDEILERLSETGREIITLSNEQIADFSGNALELTGRDGRILALSTRAFECLTFEQRETIESSARLVPISIPTIEMAGGSVRCMLAGIHLAKR